MNTQKTLKKKITLNGIGIHSGERAEVTLHPANENTGRLIKMRRNDREYYFPCTSEYVWDTRNQVSLGIQQHHVKTVEHLLSVLNAFHISNCIIETSSAEIPILDGSSYPFVEAIKSAGILEQDLEQPVLNIPHPIWITDEDRYLIILPDTKERINFQISFQHPLLGHQECYFEMNEEIYEEEISKARTFGFYRDWQKLKEMGLGLGCSFENTLVYSDDRVMNEPRYDNESVRHKVLDLYGDFSLLGVPIVGYIIANKSGHKLNVVLIDRIKREIIGNQFTRKEIRSIHQEFERFISSNDTLKKISL